MALDFPSGASTGAVYTGTNGTTYTYDGVHWNGQVAAPATDALSSGDARLVVTSDNTVTFPTLTTMSDTTASVVFNLADAIISGLVNYSTTSTDTIAEGVYGNTATITAPYAVVEFTVAPGIPLLVGDIMSGAGFPVPSYITFVGTLGFSSIVITASDFSQYALAVLPAADETVTLARPQQTLAFDIQAPADTSILINPGSGGNIILNHDLIPFEDNTQSLGSVLNRWRHIWVSGGSIYIKDLSQNLDVGITARDGLLTVLGSAGLKVGEFTFQDNEIGIADNARDIIIGSTTATGYVQFNRPVKMVDGADHKVFDISRDGLVSIFPTQNIATTQSALSIVGNQAGIQQPRNFTGTMLQITGQDGISARVSIDSFGTGAYPLIAGRQARGTVTAPTTTLDNDVLFRFSVQGYGDNQYVSSIGRMSFEAAENFTNATAGTRIKFQLTPTGTTVIQTSTVVFDSQGISLLDNPSGGITFRDNTRQTTAFTGTVDVSNINNFGTVGVTSISIGTGLTGSGGPGVASVNNNGVITVAGTANQIAVNGGTTATRGSLTLSLPQDIAPTSNVTFNDVNVNGTLNFLSTSTILIPSTVEGTILYLGFTATSTSTLDGGGIQLGNTATHLSSILWNRAGNYWDFGGSGIRTLDFGGTTATVEFLVVNTEAHFGNSNIVGDYPTAEIQIDSNIDSYSQVVFQNHSSSTVASTDFVATNNIGDDAHHYIDMGINSSNYSTSTWTVNGADDGYLYVDGGNLALGTTATNIKFFTAGTLADNIRATIDASGLNVVNTVTSAGFYGPLTGDVTGNVTGTVSGNAGSVTNGVYSNQTYNNPVWIATLAGSKITGVVSQAATVTNGVYTTDNGTVSNNMLAGGITNAKLSSSTITLNVSNGITVTQSSPSLGGSTTIGFNTATLVAQAVSVVGGIGVATLTAGTGTAVSASSGNVTVWNTIPAYTLTTATASALGGVKIGANITAAGDGTISVATPYVLTTATSGVLGGVKIGSGVNVTGDGTISVTPFSTSTLVSDAVTAQTANKLTTATTINGVSFDGSASVTVHTAGSGIDISGTTVTNLGVISISAGTGTAVTASTGTVTMYIGQAVGISNDVTFNSVSDAAGNLRSIPIRSTSTSYTLLSTDSGQVISITTGSVTIPANVFASPYGQTISIYNNTVTTMSVLADANVTLRLAGTLSTGTRTLARYGIASVMAVSSNTFVISGAGLA